MILTEYEYFFYFTFHNFIFLAFLFEVVLNCIMYLHIYHRKLTYLIQIQLFYV